MVRGSVAPGFETVRATFEELFAGGAETGASVAAYVGGTLVVDLWGGWADAARTRPWQEDTLATVFSAGKPVAALAVLRRVADGRIDLDAPIVAYWPAFPHPAATVRHALAHQAGVPAANVSDISQILDASRFAAAIAATPPEWEPGTALGEHALTYGTILGEILRGATGETVGEVVRTFGLDVHFGLSAADQRRCAEVEHATPDWPQRQLRGHGELWARALGPAELLATGVVNGPLWRGGELPAVNCHATARGLATCYDRLPELLPAPLLAEATGPQAVGFDRLLEQDATWTLGWRRDGAWFGMGGIGGSSAGSDESLGYSLAYVTRRLGDHDRGNAMYDALEAALRTG
ncbi:serine hydrolase domain-containing protein [Dactylosporangium aurantiacum]|nr:serine hydrolase domain-containing protein [Dactylosporangium aurantiacum]MDG6101682.1 serine hydrolase [Dactylosporangium aurantiacum]